MSKKFISVSLVFALAACGSAVPVNVPKSDTPEVDAVVADIASGNGDKALAQIDKIQSISLRPLSVSSPSEFVAALKGCSVTSNVARPPKSGIVQTEWKCDSGPVVTLLAKLPGQSKITIGDIRAL